MHSGQVMAVHFHAQYPVLQHILLTFGIVVVYSELWIWFYLGSYQYNIWHASKGPEIVCTVFAKHGCWNEEKSSNVCVKTSVDTVHRMLHKKAIIRLCSETYDINISACCRMGILWMSIAAQTGYGIGAVDQTRHHQSKSYAFLANGVYFTLMLMIHNVEDCTCILCMYYGKTK
jgi:hypothetical protein